MRMILAYGKGFYAPRKIGLPLLNRHAPAMETSNLPAPNTKQPSRRSSSSHSTRTTSGAQQKYSRSGEGGAVSENTPINLIPTRRDYQSTDGMRNESSQGKNRDSSQSQDEGTSGVSVNPGHGENHQRPWYIQLANRYGSMELENKGSVARDHLALERTFLAWLRTSLAFASIGIAITQLFRLSNAGNLHQSGTDSSSLSPLDHMQVAGATKRLRNLGKPLGTTFIAVAILILLVGFHRFVESQYWIVRGKFPASRGSVILIAFVTVALIIAALVVILAVAPGAVET